MELKFCSWDVKTVALLEPEIIFMEVNSELPILHEAAVKAAGTVTEEVATTSAIERE